MISNLEGSLKINDYKNDFQEILKMYQNETQSKNKTELKHNEITIKIFEGLIHNTFCNEDERISLINIYKKRPEDHKLSNDLNSIILYINRKNKLTGLLISKENNKSKSYIVVEKKMDKNSITRLYISKTIEYIENKKNIKRIRMFCNLNYQAFASDIEKLLHLLIIKEIECIFMSNYSYKEFHRLVGDNLTLILTDREKGLGHMVAIFELSDVTNDKAISKRDTVTDINISPQESEGFKSNSVIGNFVVHHNARMEQIELDAELKVSDEYSNSKGTERHTLMLNKDTINKRIDTKVLYNKILNLATHELDYEKKYKDEVKILKEKRDECLNTFNLLHTKEEADTAILKSTVWLLYSIFLIELRNDEEEISRLQDTLYSKDKNIIIWKSLRRLRVFFRMESSIPLFEKSDMREILEKIHFDNGGLPPLSGEFPEVSFPADRFTLKESLERIVRENELRNRFSQYLNEEPLKREIAAQKITELILPIKYTKTKT